MANQTHDCKNCKKNCSKAGKTSRVYISDECINCGACVDTCPVEAIVPSGTQYMINDKCIECGNCLGICPVDAIKSE